MLFMAGAGEEMVNPASLMGPGSHHTVMLDL